MMQVLEMLNIDKSRDQDGHANKTFKEGVAGSSKNTEDDNNQ